MHGAREPAAGDSDAQCSAAGVAWRPLSDAASRDQPNSQLSGAGQVSAGALCQHRHHPEGTVSHGASQVSVCVCVCV